MDLFQCTNQSNPLLCQFTLHKTASGSNLTKNKSPPLNHDLQGSIWSSTSLGSPILSDFLLLLSVLSIHSSHKGFLSVPWIVCKYLLAETLALSVPLPERLFPRCLQLTPGTHRSLLQLHWVRRLMGPSSKQLGFALCGLILQDKIAGQLRKKAGPAQIGDKRPHISLSKSRDLLVYTGTKRLLGGPKWGDAMKLITCLFSRLHLGQEMCAYTLRILR